MFILFLAGAATIFGEFTNIKRLSDELIVCKLGSEFSFLRKIPEKLNLPKSFHDSKQKQNITNFNFLLNFLCEEFSSRFDLTRHSSETRERVNESHLTLR